MVLKATGVCFFMNVSTTDHAPSEENIFTSIQHSLAVAWHADNIVGTVASMHMGGNTAWWCICCSIDHIAVVFSPALHIDNRVGHKLDLHCIVNGRLHGLSLTPCVKTSWSVKTLMHNSYTTVSLWCWSIDLVLLQLIAWLLQFMYTQEGVRGLKWRLAVENCKHLNDTHSRDQCTVESAFCCL